MAKKFLNPLAVGNLTITSVTGGGQITGSSGGSFNVTDIVYANNVNVSSPSSVSGMVTTVDGTQTMTNKTLTAPVINNPTGFLTGTQKITVGTTAPSSPTTGDLWVDTN